MKNLDEIVHNIVPLGHDVPNTLIHGLAMNSNEVNKGDIFIAIPGTRLDGHNFIAQAIDKGASAIISNGKDLGKLPVPQIKVANPRKAASIVASEFYGHPTKHLKVIGITGTNGKTTTASILKSILDNAGYKVAQIGTLGLIADDFEQIKTLTTPDPITLQKLFSQLKEANYSHIVMEVSSHALDQFRVADVDFDIAVFTNLSPEHLDYHATVESYFQSKLRLFTMLTINSTAIVNISDSFGKRISKKSLAPVVPFSKSNNNSIHYKKMETSMAGIAGEIIAGRNKYSIKSRLIGDFNSENILAAVSVAHALGENKKDIENGIRNCNSIPGRMEPYCLSSGAIVIIDYAHTPDAYLKVLSTIRQSQSDSGNLYAVFGAGGDRDKTKRPQMAEIAERFAKHCFITPDNPRTENPEKIAKEISMGFKGSDYTIFCERSLGLKAAFGRAKEKDIIIVLGKGREQYQDIMGAKIFYSDIEIIKEYQ